MSVRDGSNRKQKSGDFWYKTDFSVFDNNNIIVGNAFFAKGPKLGHLNGADVKTIKQEAWFTDRDTTLTGSVDFDDVIFKNDINVDVS